MNTIVCAIIYVNRWLYAYIYMIKGMTCLYVTITVLTAHSIYLNRNYTINGCHFKCTSIARIYMKICIIYDLSLHVCMCIYMSVM